MTHLPSLTGLRWYCALAVAVYHFSFAAGVPIEWAGQRHLVAAGYTGVTFFFVLSGFVLTWACPPAQGRGAFYRGRFARVWPAHIAMSIAALLLVPLPLAGGWVSIVQVLTLTHTWFGAQHASALNPVSWSLSCEAFFYLAFPFIVGPLSRRKHALALVVGLLALCGATALLLAAGGHRWLAYWHPLLHLPEFMLGIVVAAKTRQGWAPRFGMAPAVVTLLGVAWAAAWWQWMPFPLGGVLAALPCAAVIAAAASADLRGKRSHLARPLLQQLGAASFCLYLTHYLVGREVFARLDLAGDYPGATALIPLTVMLSASLVTALLLHHLIELPCQRWLRPRPAVPTQRQPVGVLTPDLARV